MEIYQSCLSQNGILFLSGFYTEDIPVISESCVSKGLTYVKQFERNNWVALKFTK
jgi:ribosomal protein L11 methyltransferase